MFTYDKQSLGVCWASHEFSRLGENAQDLLRRHVAVALQDPSNAKVMKVGDGDIVTFHKGRSGEPLVVWTLCTQEIGRETYLVTLGEFSHGFSASPVVMPHTLH